MQRKDAVRMALGMSQVDDIRRLWSEGRHVTEISRMTGHDRKTVRKYLQRGTRDRGAGRHAW